MPVLPDSTISVVNSAREIAGLPNAAQRYLMELMDPQCKNLFEILLYPQNLSLDPFIIAHAILDSSVARLHIQNISVPFFSFEYEKAGEAKYVKEVNTPDEITITFIENEEAFVRNWVQAWINQVVVPGGLFGDSIPYTTDALTKEKYTFSFNTNQNISKKDAKIFLQTGTSLPSPAYVQIEGLKPKTMSAWEIGHDQTDPLRIELVCAVEMVYIKAPVNLL